MLPFIVYAETCAPFVTGRNIFPLTFVNPAAAAEAAESQSINFDHFLPLRTFHVEPHLTAPSIIKNFFVLTLLVLLSMQIYPDDLIGFDLNLPFKVNEVENWGYHCSAVIYRSRGHKFESYKCYVVNSKPVSNWITFKVLFTHSISLGYSVKYDCNTSVARGLFLHNWRIHNMVKKCEFVHLLSDVNIC